MRTQRPRELFSAAGADGGTGALSPPPPTTPTAPPTPPPPRFGEPKLVDLGAVVPGVPVALDVPPSTLGFQVLVRSPGATWVGIQKITSPTGEVVFDEFKPQGSTATTAVSLSGARDVMATAAVPQTEATANAPVASGRWMITFGGVASGALRAEARIQTTSDGRFHGGELDLNLYVPDGLVIATPSAPHPITTASAAQDPDVVARVDKFFMLLKQVVGFDRGKVTFLAAPAAALVANTPPAFETALSASVGQPNTQALHVTLTNELERDGFAAWGFSPGIPGATMVAGSSMSNIVLRVTKDAGYPDAVLGDAATILHEAGHFVGLQHPTEFDGSVDGLSDTPSCPAISPTADNSACPDVTNAMFAAGDLALSPVLSKSQRAIAQASPIFRALLAAPAGSRIAPPPVIASNGDAFVRLTKSGRAPTQVERFLSRSFCGKNRIDPKVLVSALGEAAARTELTRIAADPDVPELLRQNARKLGDRL